MSEKIKVTCFHLVDGSCQHFMLEFLDILTAQQFAMAAASGIGTVHCEIRIPGIKERK